MMRLILEQQCDAHVAEMISLGAVFSIDRRAVPHGEWAYESDPPIMRNAIRRYLNSIDRDQPGFNAAMVRAILRTQFVGAP